MSNDDDLRTTKDMWRRLGRIETRIVSGFEQLGINPCSKQEGTGLRIDSDKMVVYAGDPSLTIGAITRKLNQVGAPPGTYEVVCPDCRPIEITYREETHG